MALVAGATRGAGRAIAVELARAGAFVSATGRNSRIDGPSEIGRSETIEQTCDLIAAVGGHGRGMRVDHWLRSEAMLDAFGVTEQNWQDACARVPGFALSESPTYVARGVAALAADPQLSGLAGQTPGATTNDTAWATTPRQIGQYVLVVFGAHLVLYSQDAEADRQFLAETLGMGSVDAGHGWLIFAMPPTEAAVHPADVAGAELYLMCEDLTAEIEALAARGVSCSPVEEARWGSITKIALPGGGEIGLYQPRHPLAIDRDE